MVKEIDELVDLIAQLKFENEQLTLRNYVDIASK